MNTRDWKEIVREEKDEMISWLMISKKEMSDKNEREMREV